MRPIALLLLLAVTAPLAAQAPDREIFLPRSPALSPDGSKLAFAWRGDVWLADSTGGAAVRITTNPANDGAPVFHPDGKRLAFSSDREGNRQLFLVSLPTAGASVSAPEQLTFDSQRKRLVGFTGGGADMLLAISSDRHFHSSESQRLYTAPMDGKGSKRMLFDCGFTDAAMSPDGTKVLFSRGRETWWRKGYIGAAAYQLWLADLSSGEAKLSRITKDQPGFQNIHEHSPMWAPDGKGYYFISSPDGTFDVYYRQLGSDQARRVTQVAKADGSDDGVAFPALAQNGSAMVVRRLFHLLHVNPESGATKPIELHAAGDVLADGEERLTEKSAAGIAFTKDGKQMAFVAGDDVYVMDRVLKEPRRVTSTPSRESDLVFSDDGKTLWFVSDAGGEMDIWSVACPHEEGIWWLADSFEPAQVTDDRDVESALALSPDGKRFGLLRDNQLWVMDTDGGNKQQVVETWSRPSFEWSPDGKWFCYATQDDDYNSDVWIAAIDGSRKPFNLSRHPGREGMPAWSPDGKRVAFVGMRDGEEADIYYVNLSKDDEEKTGRDRKLEEALAAMKKKDSKKKPGAGKGDKPSDKPSDEPSDKPSDEPSDEPSDKPGDKPADDAVAKAEDDDKQDDSKDKKLPEVAIDFDGILDRIHRISLADSRESGLLWSPDSKKLLFSGTVKNQRGVYAIEFPEVKEPKLVGKSGLMRASFLPSGKEVVGLASAMPTGGRFSFGGGGGAPAAMNASNGKIEKFEFTVRQARDWGGLRQLAFDQGWRAMRDRFYDPVMNHRDWDAVRNKYRPIAARCLGSSEFSDLMNLMLGELNASHMGHGGGNEPLPKTTAQTAWSATTYHLGLRFAADDGKGLLVESVIPGSPCDQDRSKVAVGETVKAIDGRALDGSVDIDSLLTLDNIRDVKLTVIAKDGQQREVSVRPLSSVASLLYDEWVEDTRKQVEALSGGKLGYLHIRGMNMSSVRQMEEDLFAAGHGKEGLIVDVRYNGGGSTADRVLTILTQPVHAITQSRGSGLGYPVDRKVYASWGKPITLMCNEFSFSNAEILAHAVKQLGRGRVVGMRTGGGVISTGSVSLADGSRVRMPMRGWYLVSNGEDMELNGCLPDIALWNPPVGDDVQLQRAAQALAEDVASDKARGHVEPRPASMRRGMRGAAPAAGSGGKR